MTKLHIAGYEGCKPPRIGSATPALLTDKYLINPVLRSRSPRYRFDEYVKDYSIVPIDPRELDPKYIDSDLVLLIMSHSAKIPIVGLEHHIDCWHSNDYMYGLFATNQEFDKYIKLALDRLIVAIKEDWGTSKADAAIDTGLILKFSDPVMNALHVKTAPIGKRNVYDRLARACLRGGVDKYEAELKKEPGAIT